MKILESSEQVLALYRQYQCPRDVNIRFWFFALATSAIKWRSNADFCCWIGDEIAALERAFPFAAVKGRVFDQRKFDEFMASRVPTPKPSAIARATAYFNSMPSRKITP